MDEERRDRWPLLLGVIAALGCGDDGGSPADTDAVASSSSAAVDDGDGDSSEPPDPSAPQDDGSGSTTAPPDGTTGDGTSDDATGSGSESGEEDPGPMVDVSDPQLYEFAFTPDEADPEASTHLGTELAALDTTVTPLGRLVVYLHGAGTPSTCGSGDHGRVLAGMGFHVVQPCYVSDYGVGNCGDDIGGCRLEAFEGVDHHPFIAIEPPNCTEVRVAAMLQHLQMLHPGGDWQYYLDGELPRWDKIVISGISHGASSSGVVGMNRDVDRVVMLSGPLDTDQAWLLGVPITPIDRFWGLTHTGDDQHPGHLLAFEDMQLLGEPTVIDAMDPPYGGSQRLVTSAPTGDGHSSTQAGGASPMQDGEWVFLPAWRLMYGADE